MQLIPLKHPISKYSHILRCWGSKCQYLNYWGGEHNLAYDIDKYNVNSGEQIVVSDKLICWNFLKQTLVLYSLIFPVKYVHVTQVVTFLIIYLIFLCWWVGFGDTSPGLLPLPSQDVNLEKWFNPCKAPLWRY